MNAEQLRKIPTIQEFFNVSPEGEIKEGTKLLLDSMVQVDIEKGKDIVTVGNECDDGMYIIVSGTAVVLSADNKKINELHEGDFIGEKGLINDETRSATVRALTDVVCANISKQLFEEIAMANRKIYGSFLNMLYTKTTKLVTEQERIKSELAIATKIQLECLENDFTEFNALENVSLTARTRPAKEVGGDFYDVFMIDKTHLCFLIADVSGKGVPAALFMSMAKTYIKTYATLNLPLTEVMSKSNDRLCYKNESGMFVTAFVCVLDLETDDVTFVNAGHNLPFLISGNDATMVDAKANLVLGMMEGVPYKEQHFELKKGQSVYLYTDGVTEAVNPEFELLGDDYIKEVIIKHSDRVSDVEYFVQKIYDEVDLFADGADQADDITMLLLSRG